MGLIGTLQGFGVSVPVIPYMEEKSCHAEPYNEEERGTEFTKADLIVACVSSHLSLSPSVTRSRAVRLHRFLCRCTVMAFVFLAASGTILDLSMQNDPDRFKEIRKGNGKPD